MAEHSRPPQIAIAEAIRLLQTFPGADLTQTIYQIEKSLRGVSTQNYSSVLSATKAKAEVLSAAGLIKQLAGQINVVIHALGILLCLPHILQPGESIDYVSLGAGNTGRAFDLETTLRVAEFKFIHWQGGPESIRQNSLFKDFYEMAEHENYGNVSQTADEGELVSRDGVLRIAWPHIAGGGPMQLDLLLATANDPRITAANPSYPDVQAIADAWNHAGNHVEYFWKNIDHDIRTFQDSEIRDRLNPRGPHA